LNLKGLFMESKQALKFPWILEKSYLSLLVKLGSNPNTNRNRIHPDLGSFIVGQFWYSKRPNWKKPISYIFVEFVIRFPTPLISLQSKIWPESYDRNTEMCIIQIWIQSDFDSYWRNSDLIISLIWLNLTTSFRSS
jgi:hypothetical protein